MANSTFRNSTLRDLALIASFAALIIVLGGFSIPAGPIGVPIVLQNIAVILTGMLLGWKRGFLAVLLFLGVGLVGIPNLAGWSTTLKALSGPTIGYLCGYMLSVITAGAIVQYAWRKKQGFLSIFPLILAGCVAIVVQYTCGIIGLMLRVGMDLQAAIAANLVYIPGDAIKVLLAVIVVQAVHKAFPDMLA